VYNERLRAFRHLIKSLKAKTTLIFNYFLDE
jgi:hypothetical protein